MGLNDKKWHGTLGGNLTERRLLELDREIDALLDAQATPRLFVSPSIDGEEVTGCPRPPWWRPFARRRWDRTVAEAQRLRALAHQRMLDAYPGGIILRGRPPGQA